MKFLPALLVFLILPGPIRSQTKENDSEKMIERIIRSGAYFGVDDKRLGWMGDAAAVVLTKVLADKNPGPREIDMILGIIHMSFSAPRLVENVPDREPRTTQFVLRYLDLSTTDEKLKQRIAEETEFVLSQYAGAPKD